MVIQGTYLNVTKATYDKPKANIIFNGQKLKVFPLRSRTKQGRPFFVTLIQHSTRSPSHSNQTRKKIKGIQVRKEVKLSLFADDMIL